MDRPEVPRPFATMVPHELLRAIDNLAWRRDPGAATDLVEAIAATHEVAARMPGLAPRLQAVVQHHGCDAVKEAAIRALVPYLDAEPHRAFMEHQARANPNATLRALAAEILETT